MKTTIASWAARIIIGGLFIFTGIFKLTGNPEAQETFAQIGGAPMMYLTGVIELIGAALLLIPRTRVYGGLLAMGTMGGAIVSHLTGMVPNDEMFPLAIVLFLLSGLVLYLHRAELPIIGPSLAEQEPATAPGMN